MMNHYSIQRDEKVYIWNSNIVNNEVGESKRIRTVPEYGHYRYLINHKSYKKIVINKIFIII